MNTKELESLHKETVDAVIDYAKTGQGYFRMQRLFNELSKAECSFDSSFDLRDVALARRITAQGIIIDSMYALNKYETNKVESELLDIANNIPEQAIRRGYHR